MPNMPLPSAVPTRVRVAGFWQRSLGAIVDGAILVAVFAVLFGLCALVIGEPIPRLSQLGPDYFIELALNGSALTQAGLFLFCVCTFLYFFIFHATRGQSPGQRLCGMRVIDAYGQAPSLRVSLFRTLVGLPSILLFAIGHIWIGFDREKRSLHDWLADTYVIRVEGDP
jgi:uncharacterized RDD family membrane protein YckC